MLKATSTYLPALDGLRAIAIMVVIVSHYGLGHVIPGGFGVTLFFFISGFLITRLMISEYEQRGAINLKNFYIRRFLRLYPALLFMLLVGTSFVYLAGGSVSWDELSSCLFYYRNYFIIYLQNSTPNVYSIVYNILWSLAIEEHFYIVFPLVFVLLYRRKPVFYAVLLAGLAGSLAWRYYLILEGGPTQTVFHKIYYLTETRADAIIYGCLVSLLLNGRAANKFIAVVSNPLSLLLLVSTLLFTFTYRNPVFRETARYSLQGIVLSGLIPALLNHPRFKTTVAWLSVSWMQTVGRLSYSLYLFHWIGVSVAMYWVGSERLSPLWISVAVAVGLPLSLLSYYYVEQPVLQLRKRFGSNVDVKTQPVVQPALEVSVSNS